MLDYLFFNDAIAQRFRDYLKSLGLVYEDAVEPIQNAYIIKIDEPDDVLWDQIDDVYDVLADEDQRCVESQDDDGDDRAGIYLQLANGSQTIAKVDPAVLNKMLTVITMEELNQFLDIVVKSVESPDDSPICKTVPVD